MPQPCSGGSFARSARRKEVHLGESCLAHLLGSFLALGIVFYHQNLQCCSGASFPATENFISNLFGFVLVDLLKCLLTLLCGFNKFLVEWP